MKRSSLQRHTPLTSGSSLARAPFRTTSVSPQRTAPIQHRGSRKTRADKAAECPEEYIGEGVARERVYARSAGRCEIRIPGVCFGYGSNFHHRQNKSQLGKWHPSNGLHLCGSGSTGCHGWVTEHPADSARMGWTVLSGEDPLLKPAVIFNFNYELGERIALVLLPNGDVEMAPFPEGVTGDPFTMPVPAVDDVLATRKRGVA